jgi:biopolymer transport protein ExbD
MRFRDEKKESARIDMTSLIDVVFLLLIFFMVSTTFLDRPGLKLSLPDTKSATPIKMEKMVVTVTRDDRLFVGIEELDFDILGEKVKEYIQESGKKTIRIRGDQKVNFGTVIKVMDICRLNGATGVTIETEKRK